MIKITKKSGFSLAESLISMMLLVLVIMLTMTSITRKKVQHSSSQVHGIYACWENGAGFKQFQYNGNSIDRDIPEDVPACRFKMSRKVSEYYFTIVGSRKCSGGVCVDGQMIQDARKPMGAANDDQMNFDIVLGDDTNGGATVLTQDGSLVYKALGGITKNDSGIVPGNFDKGECVECCKVASHNPCSSGYNPKCEILTSSNGKTDQNPYDSNIKITCTSGDTSGETYIMEDVGELTPQTNGIYTGDFTSNGVSKTVGIKVREKDSYLRAVPNNNSTDSPIVRFIKTIPYERQNTVTEEFLRYYTASPNQGKKGVVVIVW